MLNIVLVHHHGDARPPRTCRPLQSVFSCLIVKRTDHAPIPIRPYTSPRLHPRDLSQRLHRERAQSLYEATYPGNSREDIFLRPRQRGEWENGGGRRRRRASRIASCSSSTHAAPDSNRATKVGLIYTFCSRLRTLSFTANISHSRIPHRGNRTHARLRNRSRIFD